MRDGTGVSSGTADGSAEPPASGVASGSAVACGPAVACGSAVGSGVAVPAVPVGAGVGAPVEVSSAAQFIGGSCTRMSTVAPGWISVWRRIVRTAWPRKRGSSTRTVPDDERLVVGVVDAHLSLALGDVGAQLHDRRRDAAGEGGGGRLRTGRLGAAGDQHRDGGERGRDGGDTGDAPHAARRTISRATVTSSRAASSISTPSPGPVGTRT